MTEKNLSQTSSEQIARTESVDPAPDGAPTSKASSPDTSASSQPQSLPTLSKRLWWAFRFVLQPFLFFVAGAGLFAFLGFAQKIGWISAGGAGSSGGVSSETASAGVDYICPMMCTPPQKEPGRCPVCAMELVPASAGGGGDERSVVVDPATRRVANIQTVSVQSLPLTRTVRAVGQLQYDESSLKTIAAYTDGRFDRLYVDFTGAVVGKGDLLASFYSPELYSAQVEYLQASQAVARQSSKGLASIVEANRRLQVNSRQRLIELGMSEAQIAQLDKSQKPRSRMDIVAPMSGTVIEKMVVEGEYVKEGQAVFRLADLSTVWLMLELFPQDVPCVCYGQAVEATMKSLPGRTFVGRIAFIDPDVDPKSRTVSVRVVFDNQDGQLRIGDYAKAKIEVPIVSPEGERSPIFDPELAGKWISPKYPHIICDEPGVCPLSGEPLLSAASLGFSEQPTSGSQVMVVPRNAVLMAADHCVVYVETEPGRFEIRRVITGATAGDDVVIIKGVSEGEKVATSGNFLLDSQMQLAGNPSLIDPTRAAEPMKMVPGFSAEMLATIRQLPEDDQSLVMEQVICPVTNLKLGSMGIPPKVQVKGETVFLCCEGCRESLLKDPEGHLKKIREYRERGGVDPDEDNSALPPIDGIEVSTPEVLFPEMAEIESLAPDIPGGSAEKKESALAPSTSGRTQ